MTCLSAWVESNFLHPGYGPPDLLEVWGVRGHHGLKLLHDSVPQELAKCALGQGHISLCIFQGSIFCDGWGMAMATDVEDKWVYWAWR